MARLVAGQDVRIISVGNGRETFVLVRGDEENVTPSNVQYAMKKMGMEFPKGYRVLGNVQSVRWECTGRLEDAKVTIVLCDVPVDVIGELESVE